MSVRRKTRPSDPAAEASQHAFFKNKAKDKKYIQVFMVNAAPTRGPKVNKSRSIRSQAPQAVCTGTRPEIGFGQATTRTAMTKQSRRKAPK